MTRAGRIAVIVVNWNVREMLRECLRSLADAGGWAPGEVDVIVVDNASADGSAAMVAAEFPAVRLVANADNVGFGAANNQALALTAAETLVLLNPDTVVADGALARMVAALDADPRIGVLGCRLLNRDGTLQRWTAGQFPTLANAASHYLFLDRLLPRFLRPRPLYLDRDIAEPAPVGWVSGACMAIRREALGGRPLFDPRFFMYAEDMELCHRVHAAGWKVIYDPRMSIVHYQGASLQQQQADVMLSSLRSPRDFFEALHGRRAARALDALTVAGFWLRRCVNATLARLSGSAAHRARAASSHRYLLLAIEVMREVRHRGPLRPAARSHHEAP